MVWKLLLLYCYSMGFQERKDKHVLYTLFNQKYARFYISTLCWGEMVEKTRYRWDQQKSETRGNPSLHRAGGRPLDPGKDLWTQGKTSGPRERLLDPGRDPWTQGKRAAPLPLTARVTLDSPDCVASPRHSPLQGRRSQGEGPRVCVLAQHSPHVLLSLFQLDYNKLALCWDYISHVHGIPKPGTDWWPRN